MARPRLVYEHGPGSPIDVDRQRYRGLAEALGRKLVHSAAVPPRSAYAWTVRRGQIFRIIAPEGPQVGDLNLWNVADPRERFWAARTKQLHSAHVSTYDRLWSSLPYLRPMCTVIADSVDYGIDEDGAGCHDLLGTRCDPYVTRLLAGQDDGRTCHSNLARAIASHGLSELDVHDVLNVFMVTGLTSDGRYFVKPSPARAGDHLELVAEMDLLCALSACSHGDLSVDAWGSGDAVTCRPLAIEVYDPPAEFAAG